MRKSTVFRTAAFALIAAFAAAPAIADTTHTTPNASEMSPSQWRHLQLVAADQSDKIMQDARKQQGLLAQYLFMQTHYDTNHERAFQLIFGQYLSWFQTFIGDYDGAAASFSIAQPAQPDDARSPLAGGGARELEAPWKAIPSWSLIGTLSDQGPSPVVDHPSCRHHQGDRFRGRRGQQPPTTRQLEAGASSPLPT